MARISIAGKFSIPSSGSFNLNKLATASSFVPTDISGLLVWLKPESLDALADGDPISTWSDSSGNGYDATQTLTKRPTKQTVSGKSVARFDGSNDSLGNSTLPAIGTGSHDIFVVVKRNGGTGWRTLLSIGNENSGSNTMISASITTDNIYVNPLGSGSNVTDGAFTDATTLMIEARNDAGTVYARKYGTSETSGALVLNLVAGYVLGDYSSVTATQPFPGDLFELILYNSNLSAGNRTSVENYLVTKYGL